MVGSRCTALKCLPGGAEATIKVVGGCLHEHVNTEYVCQSCYDRCFTGSACWTCDPCFAEDLHLCDITFTFTSVPL